MCPAAGGDLALVRRKQPSGAGVSYAVKTGTTTNVYGAQNLIEASLQNNVKSVIAIGTDKGVSPFNTYGATKFLMDRLFVSANNYKVQRLGDIEKARGYFERSLALDPAQDAVKTRLAGLESQG